MALNAAVLGAGFIGQNFIRRALQRGYNLRVLDHKNCPPEFEGKLTWLQGDFSSEEAVAQSVRGAEVVFHFISSTVPGDVVDEGRELMQNVVQTIQLLKVCVRERVRRVVFASSASVYGVQARLPVQEGAATDPISSHGIHKLTIEKYLQLYRYQHGLDCKILRLSNPYGPGQSVLGRQGFVAIAIGKLMAGEQIEIRGDGSTIRDFVYIDDVTEALDLAATTGAIESVFNVGSGHGYSLNDIVAALAKVTGKPVATKYVEGRFVDIPASILDISLEKHILGKTPKIGLEQGLARTLAFHGIKSRHEFLN
jgi:UDP-glucose 4-epimerase